MSDYEPRTPESVSSRLLRNGYKEVQEAAGVAAGDRVRHYGHQWAAAYRNGTGNIERVFHKPDSAWSKSWHKEDIELIVKRDNGEYMFVAQYHVEVMREAL